MTLFFVGLLASGVFWLLFGGFVMLRNTRVFQYRMNLINRIAEANQRDLRCSRDIDGDYMWRWREYEAVSHERMVYSLRRLDSFYSRDPARSER